MHIEYSDFVTRQFKTEFTGTKIKEKDIDVVLKYANENIHKISDSYQPFCKYLIVENNFDIDQAVIERSIEHQMFLRTGYSSRTPDELQVLSEWLELPKYFKKPKAKYLVYVLYTREQLEEEYLANLNKNSDDFELSENCEYGIVAILGCAEPKADPMTPMTIIRNALGKEEGGNGAKLDHEMYKESVEFWNKYILMK